jgi:diadenylate cyclase
MARINDDTDERPANDERPDHDARDDLNIAYAHHRRIEEMVDIVRYCLQS